MRCPALCGKSLPGLRVAGALILLAATPACPPANAPCTRSADCRPDEICVDTTCRRACNSRADCGASERCQDGACLPGVAPALDATTTDLASWDLSHADGESPDTRVADGSASVDAGPVDATAVDTPAVADATRLDQEPPDLGAPFDVVSDGGPPDAASPIDALSLIDAMSAPDSALPDTEGTDRWLCLPGHVDVDADCHVTGSATQVCFVDQPPDGICVSPNLQTQVRPPSGSASQAGGGTAWSNPDSVLVGDDLHATASLEAQEDSEVLRLTNLGFTVPGGATLTGIAVEIERSAGNSTPVVDQEVRLLRNGNTIGNDLASATPWPDVDTLAVYGSPSDLWGRNWSINDVNNSGFGVSFSVRNGGTMTEPDAVARVDAIRVRVFFRFDCDDDDATTYQLLYRDSDGDGYGVGAASCVGAEPGWTDRPGDCDDDNAALWRAAYRDLDGDGYGAGAQLCVGDEPGYVALGTDCLDSKASVHPGQLQYFTAHRGDGSFDYNCDSLETRRADCLTTASLTSCQNTDILDVNLGWVNTVPACGVTGTYRGCIESMDAVCSDSEFDGVRACSTTQDCSLFSYNEIRDIAAAQPCR